MDNVTKVFSKRLKQLRGNKSQDDVAKDIGISRGALSYYEKGERNPDINILSSIAKYYNVSADYLLGLSDTPTLSVEEKAICDTIGLSKNSGKSAIRTSRILVPSMVISPSCTSW